MGFLTFAQCGSVECDSTISVPRPGTLVPGWIMVKVEAEEPQTFCSYACLVEWAADQAGIHSPSELQPANNNSGPLQLQQQQPPQIQPTPARRDLSGLTEDVPAAVLSSMGP